MSSRGGSVTAMCGRYASSQTPGELAEQFSADGVDAADLGARFNVAPTDPIYAVLERAKPGDRADVVRQLRDVRWGLVPSWAKDPSIGSRLINARVETIAEKPSWRTAFRKRRCILPASGYYEWMPEHNEMGKAYKQPYYLRPAAGDTLSFAGLYELWPDPTKDEDDDAADRWLWTAAIITCAATGPAGEVHDRTPLVIPDDRVDAWLSPGLQHPKEISEVIAGIRPPLLGVRAVATTVNRVGNDGPELIAPLTASAETELQLSVVAA